MQDDDWTRAEGFAPWTGPAANALPGRADSTRDPFDAWQQSVQRLRKLEQRLDDARLRRPQDVARLVTQVRVLHAATAELHAVAHPREKPRANSRGFDGHRFAPAATARRTPFQGSARGS